MIPGDTFQVLSDEENPLRSPNTQAVAAIITAGGKLAQSGGYTHAVEQTETGTRRTVTWVVEEKPLDICGEKIMPTEFLRRWRDRAWCMENPDHPISWMHGYQANLSEMRDQIRTQSPQIKIRRKGRIFTLKTVRAADGTLQPDAEGKKLLERFG